VFSAPTRRRHRRLPWLPAPAAALAAVAACGVLAACGGGAAGGTGSGPALTLYSGQHPQTTQALVKAFEGTTGITVNVRSDDEDALANQIATEGARSPADLFFTENTPPLELLQDKGLLSAVKPATLALAPAKYSSPQGDWAGVSARVSVIVYNPKLIKPAGLPTHIKDFADPKFKGKLALAPQETDFQPIITSLLRAYGKQATLSWLEGIKANASGHIYPDNETLVDKVSRGQATFGVINQYYWYRLRAELGAGRVAAEIVHFAPRDPGYVIDVSGVGILKSSKHQEQDQKFVAFLLSPAGQQIIGNPQKSISYEYPIASGVTGQEGETPLSQLQPDSISLGDLGDGSAAIALMHQAGLL